MISSGVLITIVLALAGMTVSIMAIQTKLLGDRIGSVETSLGARIGGVELGVNRSLGGVETRLGAIEGAVRDVGERLTVLETDLGKR